MKLINNKKIKEARALATDFARLLAAYFLGLRRVPASVFHTKNPRLPNLLAWSIWMDEEATDVDHEQEEQGNCIKYRLEKYQQEHSFMKYSREHRSIPEIPANCQKIGTSESSNNSNKY
jgi:hypothetical protein